MESLVGALKLKGCWDWKPLLRGDEVNLMVLTWQTPNLLALYRFINGEAFLHVRPATYTSLCFCMQLGDGLFLLEKWSRSSDLPWISSWVVHKLHLWLLKTQRHSGKELEVTWQS